MFVPTEPRLLQPLNTFNRLLHRLKRTTTKKKPGEVYNKALQLVYARVYQELMKRRKRRYKATCSIVLLLL